MRGRKELARARPALLNRFGRGSETGRKTTLSMGTHSAERQGRKGCRTEKGKQRHQLGLHARAKEQTAARLVRPGQREKEASWFHHARERCGRKGMTGRALAQRKGEQLARLVCFTRTERKKLNGHIEPIANTRTGINATVTCINSAHGGRRPVATRRRRRGKTERKRRAGRDGAIGFWKNSPRKRATRRTRLGFTA